MKKLFLNSFMAILLCCSLLCGGSFFATTFSAEAEQLQMETSRDSDFETLEVSSLGTTVTITSNSDMYDSDSHTGGFAGYISNYGVSNVNDNIILKPESGEVIDMKDYPLTSTIGTKENPFCGTFNGNGYTIKNLNFTLSGNEIYGGLFGYTSSTAEIKNLHIINSTMTLNSASYAYVGALVGSANGAKIENVFVSGDIQLNVASSCAIFNFGLLAGELNNSSLKNCMVRTASVSQINLSSTYSASAKIGGLVGNLNQSQITFCISQTQVDVDLSNYTGSANIGGLVGYISQAGSKVINCVSETTLSENIINGNIADVNVGLLIGKISNPVPDSYNVSYCYYYSSGYNIYNCIGDSGNYDVTSQMYLDAVTYKITSKDYFSNHIWNPAIGDYWDFDNIWYISEYNINLQAFFGSFNIDFSPSSDVLTITQGVSNTCRYGDVVEVKFNFLTENLDYSNFYDLANITLNAQTVATFKKTDNSYSMIKTLAYSRLEFLSEEDAFILRINGMTKNYIGTFVINVSYRTFVGKFTYKLFDETGTVEKVEDFKTECNVYHTANESSSSSVTISDLTYGYSDSISTASRVNSVYAFEGWYIESETGDQKLVEFNTQRIAFTFGQDKFKIGTSAEGEDIYVTLDEDFTIYAKYISNACLLTFKFDDGTLKINLGDGRTISQTGTTVSLLKQQSEFKMQIYIAQNYKFNVDEFVKFLNTYKCVDENVNFCTYNSDSTTELEDGTTCYEFFLNLANLKVEDYDSGFSIDIGTVKVEQVDNNLLWIILGCVGGVILIVGIVILIVLLRRRSGGGKIKVKKSSYKNMYY